MLLEKKELILIDNTKLRIMNSCPSHREIIAEFKK